jgi:thiamine biosynthesis lipoprotein
MFVVFLSRSSMNLPGIIRIVAVACLVIGCQRPQPVVKPATAPAAVTRFEYSQIYMGVRTRLVVYASDETAAVNACRAAFKRVGEVDQAASDYLKDSELNKLCATAATRPVALSDDLLTLLVESQALAERSEGAFDITVGPYVRLWRVARKEKKLPAPEALAAAAKVVGWRKLTVDVQSRTARLGVTGMQLDMGGIAKGYAGDCAIQTLREQGIKSALFEAGGDIVISDAPPGEEGWNIELEDAGPDMPKSLRLHNCAVSTSGDTMQFVEIDGKRYSHVVDPRTGIGLTTRAMATVVAPKGIWSDALSKPAEMLPKEKLDALLKLYPGTKAYTRVLH